MLSKVIPKTNKYHYRFVLTLVFVAVSFVVLATSLLVTAYYQLNGIHKEFNSSAKKILSYKQNFLFTQTSIFKNYLSAVDNTLEFESFLQSDKKEINHQKEHIQSIMLAIAHSNQNIMQFRFLDKSGQETIRIDRKTMGSTPYKVVDANLQNKAQRYYFSEIKNIDEGNVWFSKIDLNMEHDKIVKPITPTLRVAKPYYLKGEFKGILIINIFMEKILDEIIASELFNIALIDKDSYILTSNLKGYAEDNKEWTRYLKKEKNTKYIFNNKDNNFFIDLIFKKNHSALDLSQILKNNEGLKIVIEEKTEKLIGYIDAMIEYMIFMGLFVFAISFPIAILLSKNPIKLHAELKESRDELAKDLDIIDKYVYMSTTDIDGNITDASTAFLRLTGYTKEELIGVNHRILKAPNTSSSLYKAMWKNLLSGKEWRGVLQNIAKDGKKYWVNNYIVPIIKDKKISGFSAIQEDITAQKIMEEISIKDELTKAYNRRFFNQTFTKELKRAKRKDDIFCIAMFDIDYFKKYNDTYGHIKGDEALITVASTLSSKLQRSGDYLFRVGGEEFIIIYSDAKSFEEAKEFASEIVKEIQNIGIEHKASECNDVLTISLGLLAISSACEMDEEKIMLSIDELLYKAKDSGRNQFVAQMC